jgi:hypothetical protein
VITPAVFAELLAVIGGDDHGGVRSGGAESRHDRAERRVRRRDLGVVAIDVAIAECILRVRLVRLVGPEQVHPHEQLLLRGGRGQILLHLPDAPLALGELHPAILEIEVAVAKRLESRRIDEEDGRRVKRGRAVTVESQEACPGVGIDPRVLQQERPHVLAGHQRRNGVRRMRRRSVRPLEYRSFFREAIEIRCRRSLVTISADVIRAQSVDGHEQEVATAKIERTFDRGVDGRIGVERARFSLRR